MLRNLLILLSLAIAAYGAHKWDKHNAVKQAENALISQYNKKADDARIKALEQTAQLRADADKKQKEKDEKIAAINTKLSAALSELRKRPVRSTKPEPTSTSVAKACTGAELYREDAEFLTREAARAESVLLERDYYYNNYEALRRSLEQNRNNP